MSKSVLFLPIIKSVDELQMLLIRVGWYLYPYRLQISSVFLPMSMDPPSEIAVSGDYDPAIRQRLSEMLARCSPVMVDSGNIETVDPELLNKADIVLVWKWEEGIRESLRRMLDQLSEGKHWYDVDMNHTRSEGSYYLWLGPQCFPDGGAAIERSREIFARFAGTVSRRKAYVFGTGPSLANVSHLDFSDGECYVANSMVKNRALLARLKPKALVAADPIFHAGCSAYAAEFRRQLIEALDEFGMYFFVPVRDYHIYRTVLPARQLERLICVPYDDKAPYNIDLGSRYYVNGTGNILTLFLLPLAATFHDEISVLGCDGRPRSENKYFWSHDPASQFGDLMQTAMVAHPAFFAIDYDDYYDEHLQTLAHAVDVIEQSGKRLVSLTPSHIPALAIRYVKPDTVSFTVSNSDIREKKQGVIEPGKELVEVVGLAPDATSEVGHYFGYEDHLLATFARAGIPYLTLCNKSIPPSLLAGRPGFFPALTVHSWDIGNNWEEPPASRLSTFLTEVEAGIDAIVAKRGGANRVLYLYYGSLYHVELLAALLEKRPELGATVNLFWTCNDPIWSDGYAKRWSVMGETIRKSMRLHVTVSTVELQRELELRLGLWLPLAPHPSSTFADDAYLSLRASSSPGRHDGRCRVVFPGMLRRDKGFHLAVETARILSQDDRFQCTMRSLSLDDTPVELITMVQRLEGVVHVVQGELDRDGFIDFLRQGQIAVIPYSVQAFARRTSGLLVDALYCGLPVVAIQGSWLGNRVVDAGAGRCVTWEDPEQIVQAVKTIYAELPQCRVKAFHAGAAWFQSNSWMALAASILTANQERS